MIPVLPVFFIVLLLGAINIAILLIPIRHNLKFLDTFKYFLLSWAMGLLTPARIGEFSMIYYLSRHKVRIGVGTAVTLIDKLITTGLYLIIGFLGLVLFFYSENMQIFFIFLIAYILIFIVIIFIIISDMGRKLIKNILKHNAKKFKGFSKTLSIYIKKRPDLLAYNLIITIIKTILLSLMNYWIFLGFGVYVPFWLVLSISVLGSIISIVPISISGLGVRESLSVVLYSKFGVSASVVFSNHIISNTLSYVSAIVLIALNVNKTKHKKIIF
jgi:hypothetical protein